MRLLLAAIVVTCLPLTAAAQSRTESATKLPVLPPIGLPLSPIALPLPAIGLPLPPIGLPSATQSAIVATSPPRGRGHDGRRPGRGHDGRSRYAAVYFVPAYDWGLGIVSQPLAESSVTASTTTGAPAATVGRLRLDVDADSEVQLFVDGYFAGTIAELNQEIEIDAGPHRIELRAAGYETQRVDVRISASRTIGYRTTMIAVEPTDPPAPATEPIPRTTIYFIPGCYLGNIPPAEVSLPAGCDLSKLTIRKP